MATSWASDAALNSLVTFMPQKEALKDLQRQAEEQAQASIQAGKTEGTLGVQAAQAAVAPTKRVYETAAKEGERGRALTAPVLAALGASNPFSVAAGNEAAAGNERRANSQATALSDLQQRKVAATELPAFSRSTAMATLFQELRKLQGKEKGLLGQEAANTQNEVNKSRKEAGKESAAAAREARKDQFTRELHGAPTYKDLHPNAGSAAGEIKPASRKEQNAAKKTFSEIYAQAQHFFQAGRPRNLIQQTLEAPLPSVEKENANGEKESVHGHPGFTANAVLKAALDLAEKGAIGPHTYRELHEEGYDPKVFGSVLSGPITPNQRASQRRGAGSRGA